ncbi:hypothetical protein SLEP1_g23479 [Rubroshorea leprosula]|uniref:Uncharacterized protein n=1 Tax=Rubroshorea leprosula TaxID=152421 RepID=A0AAV5JJQ8_9ROSI|nr:hypothetical protein SLEP1_g23479 [Rubroshorea leprosula]
MEKICVVVRVRLWFPKIPPPEPTGRSRTTVSPSTGLTALPSPVSLTLLIMRSMKPAQMLKFTSFLPGI